MSNNVDISPGSGAIVATDQTTSDSSQVQLFKLSYSAAGIRTLVQADVDGLLVNLGSSPVVVNNPTAANLKVDASGATVPISAATPLSVAALATAPVFVRLSNGTIAVDTIPVSGTVAATQSGTWIVRLSDGTTGVAVDSSTSALKVFIAGGSTGGGTSAIDISTFEEGTTAVTPIAGEFNDSPTNPGSGKVAAVRITPYRGLHTNLRNDSGAELGISGSPLRVDPTGTTKQPVSLNDSSGTAYSGSNPLPVTLGADGETQIANHTALASGTAATVLTPTSGKRFVCRQLTLTVGTSDTLVIFDGTNASANILYAGTPPAGVFVIPFAKPWKSSTVNNLLKYTAGSSFVGDLVYQGYEE